MDGLPEVQINGIGNGSIFFISLIFYGGITAVVGVVFLVFRNCFPSGKWDKFFKPRQNVKESDSVHKQNEKRSVPDSIFPSARGYFFFPTDEQFDDFQEECGLDAVMALRTLFMGLKLSMLGVVNAAWLAPLFWMASIEEVQEESGVDKPASDWFDRLSAANLDEDDWRLWYMVAALYLLCLACMYLLLVEFDYYTTKRHEFLRSPTVQNYTIYVGGAHLAEDNPTPLDHDEQPEEKGHSEPEKEEDAWKQTAKAIYNHFNAIFHTDVLQIALPPNGKRQKPGRHLRKATKASKIADKRINKAFISGLLDEKDVETLAKGTHAKSKREQSSVAKKLWQKIQAHRHRHMTVMTEDKLKLKRINKELAKWDRAWQNIQKLEDEAKSIAKCVRFWPESNTEPRKHDDEEDNKVKPFLHNDDSEQDDDSSKNDGSESAEEEENDEDQENEKEQENQDGENDQNEGVESPVKSWILDTLEHARALLPWKANKDSSKRMTYAFVTFNKLTAANTAPLIIHHAKPHSFTPVPAPRPEDVRWSSLGQSDSWMLAMWLIAAGLTFVLCVLSILPVAFSSSLVNVGQGENKSSWMSEQFYFLDDLTLALLSPLIIVLFLRILENLLRVISGLQGFIGNDTVRIATFQKLAFFQIFEVFLVGSLSDSISGWDWFPEFWENPWDTVKMSLANSLPTKATFFVSIVLVRVVLGSTLEILRVVPALSKLWRYCWRNKESEEEEDDKLEDSDDEEDEKQHEQHEKDAQEEAKNHEDDETSESFRDLIASTMMTYTAGFVCWHRDKRYTKDATRYREKAERMFVKREVALFSDIVLLFVVVFVYSAVAPVVMVVVAFGFIYYIIVLQNQFRYVYRDRPGDTDGLIWVFLAQYVIVGMLVAQATILGIVNAKKSIGLDAFAGFLFLSTVLFWLYLRMQHLTTARQLPITQRTIQIDRDAEKNPPKEFKMFKEQYQPPYQRLAADVESVDQIKKQRERIERGQRLLKQKKNKLSQTVGQGAANGQIEKGL